MSRDCFVCLRNSKNKICTMCKCYCHPECWGKYLKNSTKIVTIIYPENVIISTPYYTTCPQCRQNIGTVKRITRADTHFARKASLITQFKNQLYMIEMSDTHEEKIILYDHIFDTILHNKNLIKSEDNFIRVLKNKLYYLYTIKKWDMANIYNIMIFGEPVSISS